MDDNISIRLSTAVTLIYHYQVVSDFDESPTVVTDGVDPEPLLSSGLEHAPSPAIAYEASFGLLMPDTYTPSLLDGCQTLG